MPGYKCAECPPGYRGSFEDGMGNKVFQRTFADCNTKTGEIIIQACADINEVRYYKEITICYN